MEKYQESVAEEWLPTFENVTREFLTDTLYKILFIQNIPNFKFEFREKEAIEYIEKILKEYSTKYDFYKDKAKKILQELSKKTVGDSQIPVMIVNDYKLFFELLRQLYEKQIKLYFSRTKMSGFPRYEKNNFFEQIWLRATPDDFNNPEKFLKKQVDMVCDNTFQKYDEETYLGKIEFLDNNILCVKNGIARTWDESSREIQFIIYNKDYYKDKTALYRPNYKFPVIRYGIFERDGKKICSINSVQNKSDSYDKNELDKKIDRKKYKANEGVQEEDISKVEPKNVIALSMFVNLLHKEGITEIEIPGLYVLDYEYHMKRNEKLLEDLKKDWPQERILEQPERYKKEKYYVDKNYGKEDVISEIKTERLFFTFRRLLQHYPKGHIKSYPGDVDSFMHLSIPVVKDKNDLFGSVFQKLYDIDKTLDSEVEL